MNKELTEAELQAIRDEAEKLYPTTTIKYNWLDVPQFNKREGYIAALTAERQRNRESDLDKIRSFVDFVAKSEASFIKSHLAEFWYVKGRTDTPTKDEFILEYLNYQNKTP